MKTAFVFIMISGLCATPAFAATMPEGFVPRLNESLNRRHLDPILFSQKMGFKRAKISKVQTAVQGFSLVDVIRAALILRVEPRWLLTGDGPRRLTSLAPIDPKPERQTEHFLAIWKKEVGKRIRSVIAKKQIMAKDLAQDVGLTSAKISKSLSGMQAFAPLPFALTLKLLEAEENFNFLAATDLFFACEEVLLVYR
jgi:hypothetical protein